jgi:hypothetical protein
MKLLRRELDEKFQAAQQGANTQVILNRGPFGGGKTHALRYYSFSENLPKIKGNKVRDVFITSVATPKQTGKPAEDFYLNVIERIDMERIRTVVAEALGEVGTAQGLNKLKEITGSDNLARAIVMLSQFSDRPLEDEQTSDGADWDEQKRLLEQYFLEGCTKQELKKLGLARNIGNSQDQFRVLAGLIRCFIGLIQGREVENHGRFCLWIDEMEDFVYFSGPQYRPFTQGLRDLIDRLPGFFTLILNFTLTDPEEFETLELIMGKALVDRITDNIIFSEMTQPEAIVYVDDLMKHWRTPDFDATQLSPHYPFETDALEYLIQNLSTRTPRSINKKCSVLLEKALSENKKANTKAGEIKIDLPLVKSVAASELEQEF